EWTTFPAPAAPPARPGSTQRLPGAAVGHRRHRRRSTLDPSASPFSWAWWEKIIVLDPANPQTKRLVPASLARRLGDTVLDVLAPVVDGLQALPVRDCNSLVVRTTDAFEAEKTRLLGSQPHHPVGHSGVAGTVGHGALRAEDDRVVGWGRCWKIHAF